MNTNHHRISLAKLGVASATLAVLLACNNAEAAEEKQNSPQPYEKDFTLNHPETGVSAQQKTFYALLHMDNLTEARQDAYIEHIKVKPEASQEVFAAAVKENRTSTEVRDGQQHAFVNIYQNKALTAEQQDLLIDELKAHPERAQSIFVKSLAQQNTVQTNEKNDEVATPENSNQQSAETPKKEEQNTQPPVVDTENVTEPPMITVPSFDNTTNEPQEDTKEEISQPETKEEDKKAETATPKDETKSEDEKAEQTTEPSEKTQHEQATQTETHPEVPVETQPAQPSTWEQIYNSITSSAKSYYQTAKDYYNTAYNSVKNYYDSAYNSVSGFYNKVVNQYNTAKKFYNIYTSNKGIIDKVVNLTIGSEYLKDNKQKLADYPTLTDKSTTYDYIKYPFTYLSVGASNAFTTVQNTYNSYYNTYQTVSSLYNYYKENPKKVDLAIKTAKTANSIISSIGSWFGFSK